MPSAQNESVGPALAARGVEKSFGPVPVLRGLDLSIARGETVLLLGGNGAGKSTLLRVLAGLARPDRGTIERGAAPLRVGHVGHHLFLYRHLTVLENLRLAAALSRTENAVDLSALLERWGLQAMAQRTIGQLSRGQQFRASICRALAGDPLVLILDEPTSSLDDASVDILMSEIERCAARGGAAVIASHDVARLRDRCSRVVVLHEGTAAYDSSRGSISAGLEFYRGVNR